jgi:hypothetical protein
MIFRRFELSRHQPDYTTFVVGPRAPCRVRYRRRRRVAIASDLVPAIGCTMAGPMTRRRGGRVHPGSPERRRRLRHLRATPRRRVVRGAQSVGNVRRVHDRALVRRVHGFVRRHPRRGPDRPPFSGDTGGRARAHPGRPLPPRRPAVRRRRARRLGHQRDLRAFPLRERAASRGCFSGRSLARRRGALAGRRAATGRRLGRAPSRLPRRAVRRASREPGGDDELGAPGAHRDSSAFRRAHRARRGLVDRAPLPDGRWPPEAVNGVFFGSAMLDYRLYRVYFPARALARCAALTGAP